MSASITAWTSRGTSPLEARVTQLLQAFPEMAGVWAPVSISTGDALRGAEAIASAFDRLVNLTMADSTLHILAIVPLWEADSAGQIETLAESCRNVQHSVSLHVIGLCPALQRLFGAKDDEAEARTAAAVEAMRRKSLEPEFLFSFTLVDDYAANGAPIGFTPDTLASFIAVFQKAFTTNHYEVLPPAIRTAYQGANLSVGVATLSFDRLATARRLLGRGFGSALDASGISASQVDAQKAAVTASKYLAGIEDRYPTLFKTQIETLYRDREIDKGAAVAEADHILDDNLTQLREHILSLLSDPSLTLPEKEAALAIMLGRDNERLSGIQYESQGVLMDDGNNVPLDLYIKAYNDHCLGTDLLPVRDKFPLLRKYYYDAEGNRQESAENELVFNPLDQIKRLKQLILNGTAFVREKSAEIESLQQADEARDQGKAISRKWVRPRQVADEEYKEQPLDEQYVPAEGLKPLPSVDLRPFLGPVRNQEGIGSCASFAVAAMYQAAMRRQGIEGPDSEMSPGFLHYYSNVLNGRAAGGSNYFEQLRVLGERGICRESLYPYDSRTVGAEPSAEAVADAGNHRVLKAKQIPLADDADRVASMKRNHKLLTSALSEGYAVGIALGLYDKFGADGAFIDHPEDVADGKITEWHAMVLAGYSADTDMYIVRNSWGAQFGEKGYCYIPSAYVDDARYNNFACVITEISDAASKPAKIPEMTANFAATESQIRLVAIRNAVRQARFELNRNQQLYAEYYKYYQQLVQRLAMPRTQETIRKAAEDATIEKIALNELTSEKLEKEFVPTLKEYKKGLRNAIIGLMTGFVGWAIPFFMTLKPWVGIVAGVLGFFGIMSWINYRWQKQIMRRRLQEQLDNLALEHKRLMRELFELQVRFHVAGMWISRYNRLSHEIAGVYDRLVSFNDTLCRWHELYSNESQGEPSGASLMFAELDPTPRLDSFFEANKDAIVGKIDLLEVFNDYSATDESLEKSQQRLEQQVLDATLELLADFNIASYMLGRNYDFLSPADLPATAARLIAVGQPTYRNAALHATPPSRILFAAPDLERQAEWQQRVNPYFGAQPNHLRATTPDALTLITLHPIA